MMIHPNNSFNPWREVVWIDSLNKLIPLWTGNGQLQEKYLDKKNQLYEFLRGVDKAFTKYNLDTEIFTFQ